MDMEQFKLFNSEKLNQKYPERNSLENWYETCEIINRMQENLTYIRYQCSKSHTRPVNIISSSKWYLAELLQLTNDNIIIQTDFKNSYHLQIVAVIPLPLELPKNNDNHIFITEILDSSCDQLCQPKELIIEKRYKPNEGRCCIEAFPLTQHVLKCYHCFDEMKRRNPDGTWKSKREFYGI